MSYYSYRVDARMAQKRNGETVICKTKPLPHSNHIVSIRPLLASFWTFYFLRYKYPLYYYKVKKRGII